MDLAAYLGTVTAMVTLAVAAMVMIVGLLGRRIDDLGTRMERLETQNHAILGAVSDLGQRVARLESHG
jgi:hypothetical protein